eukprot:6813336-Ditylum_brightwellii.AAC.1
MTMNKPMIRKKNRKRKNLVGMTMTTKQMMMTMMRQMITMKTRLSLDHLHSKLMKSSKVSKGNCHNLKQNLEEIQQLHTTTPAASTGEEAVAQDTASSAEKEEIKCLNMLILKNNINDTDGLNDIDDHGSDDEGPGDNSNNKVKAAEAEIQKMTEELHIKDNQL